MEQRNHSLQTTNENTQARVLHAEQEKVMVAASRARDLGLQPAKRLLVALKRAEVCSLTDNCSSEVCFESSFGKKFEYFMIFMAEAAQRIQT